MFKIAHKTVRLPVADYIAGYRDADRFIRFCRDCGNYGTIWICPPYSFDPLDRIKNYRDAHIIGTQVWIDEAVRRSPQSAQEQKETSYRIMEEARKSLDVPLLRIERLYPGSLAFFAGSCFLCRKEDCARHAGQPCIYPRRARSSLEAYGFDISKTASELLGIDVKWSENLVLPEYFTLVSGLFTNHETVMPEWE